MLDESVVDGVPPATLGAVAGCRDVRTASLREVLVELLSMLFPGSLLLISAAAVVIGTKGFHAFGRTALARRNAIFAEVLKADRILF